MAVVKPYLAWYKKMKFGQKIQNKKQHDENWDRIFGKRDHQKNAGHSKKVYKRAAA